MFIGILKGTPSWVFILFFALAILGYFQSRDRTVGRIRVAIISIAMIVLSIYGALPVFKSIGFIFWVVGNLVAIWLGVKLFSTSKVSYLAETKSFFVPGSWLPLSLMLVIFFTKYVTAIVYVNEPIFVKVICFYYGICSGIFFLRAIILWRSARRVVDRIV